MGNYTRTNIQLKPVSVGCAEDVLAWIQNEVHISGSIHIIPLPKLGCFEFRFTAKQRPGSYMTRLADRGYKIWAITNLEGLGQMDRLDFYPAKSESVRNAMPHPYFADYSSIAMFAFDQLQIATDSPESLVEEFDTGTKFEISSTGVLIKEGGLYHAENFLYYGEQQPKVERFDPQHVHDLKRTHCRDGEITELIVRERLPFIDDFLRCVKLSWGKPNQFPSIKRVEFKYKGSTTHSYFYDTDTYSQPYWRHFGHDGFSNCVDPKFIGSISDAGVE